MTPIISIENLRKSFGKYEAVKGISFDIPQGICFGLLGPNGAGKTTTVEMIEGIRKPSSGVIRYRGQERDDNFYQKIGIQFQSTALMDFLTTREVLQLFSELYTTPMPEAQLIERCQLADFLDTYATRLSGGQRQRLLLAVALINDPEVLFLDEPTTGLDPQARRNFWHLIQDIKQQGKTVVLTTHYMEEAELLCDQLVIMDKGEVIADGTPAQLLRQHFGYHYVCIDQQDLTIDPVQLGKAYHRENGLLAIETESVEATLNQLMSLDIKLGSLKVRNPTLDDLFLKLTGHHLRE